jgi:hypothetical protein
MAKINLYRFKYKTEFDPSGTEYVGVMADEVQAVRPDCVWRGADGYLRVTMRGLAPLRRREDTASIKPCGRSAKPGSAAIMRGRLTATMAGLVPPRSSSSSNKC